MEQKKYFEILKRNKNFLVFAGIGTLLFLTFQVYIIDLFRYLVNHVICYIDQYWGLVLLLFLWVLLGSYIYRATRNNKLYIQDRYCVISILAVLLNFYFRVIDTNFVFWGIISCDHCLVAWSDITYILAGFLVYRKFKYIPYEQQKQNANPLVRDCAITNQNEDFFGYQKMVDSLLADLYDTDVENEAFSVGIAGKWGVGKSSFINLLRNSILQKDGLIVDLYPRSSMNLSAISLDFFNSLSNTLKGYHTGSWHIVDKYVKSLRCIEGKGWFNKTIDAIEVFAKTDEKERLQNVITEIGRKIFVIIDDLDRLTAPEILEVLKIIDRNGSFKNIIFIVAYDKEYVNAVLRKYLGYEGSEMFTDKYFNFEYSLPAHNFYMERQYVANYIRNKISFNESDAVTKKDLLNVWNRIGGSVVRYLGLMRDVKRFINILMSRLASVKNDVNIEDFIFITLLRYKDLDLYYKLSTADILIGGNQFLEGDPDLLYLKETAIPEINARSLGWKDASHILQKLFPVKGQEVVHYDLKADYRKVRTTNAFDTYFFDAASGKILHKDLRRLFDSSSKEDSINIAKELYNANQTSLLQYLQSRTIKVLGTKDKLERYLEVLLYLYHYSNRNASIESLFVSFWDTDIYDDIKNFEIFKTQNEYKKWFSAFIKRTILKYPVAIGGISLNFLELQEKERNITIFEKNELIDVTLLCQSTYLNKWGENDWNLEIAFQLSIIKLSDRRPVKYVKKAGEEIKAFMSKHVQYFITNVVDAYVDSHSSCTYLKFNDWFVPSAIFQTEGYSFREWLNKYVKDDDAKYVLRRIYDASLKYGKPVLNEELQEGIFDFSEVATILRKQDAEELDIKVLDAISSCVGVDLKTLAKRMDYDEKDVQLSLSRLSKKKQCSLFWANLKHQMETIKEGDFVRLHDNIYHHKIDTLNYKVNAFVVDSIGQNSNDTIKLKGIENELSVGDVEAIPIDGIHDLCIYYDPIIAASYVGADGHVPAYNTDFSYFIDHFKNVQVGGKGTLYDEMKKTNVQFVHEVQHWLSSELNDNGLKINKFYHQ
jgi:hypothetical protein